jgi:hypothetical protein
LFTNLISEKEYTMRNGLIAAALFASLLTLPTLASAQNSTTTGVVGGAVTGAIVGGPVGAVVGGVIGGSVGAAADDQQRRAGGSASESFEVQPAPRETTCVEYRSGTQECTTR